MWAEGGGRGEGGGTHYTRPDPVSTFDVDQSADTRGRSATLACTWRCLITTVFHVHC